MEEVEHVLQRQLGALRIAVDVLERATRGGQQDVGRDDGVLDVELAGVGAAGEDLGQHRTNPFERLLSGARPVDVEQLVIELGVGEADLEAAADEGVQAIAPRAQSSTIISSGPSRKS